MLKIGFDDTQLSLTFAHFELLNLDRGSLFAVRGVTA